MRRITVLEAILEAIKEEMTRDETVFMMGECLSNHVFGLTNGLVEIFGKERIRETAISEEAILGGGVGAAHAGYRPIVDMNFADFILPALGPLLDNGASWRFTHGGNSSMPLVVLAGFGGYIGVGPQHSKCLETIIMHTPGLKFVLPSTPYDAKGLFKTAVRDNNPVVYFFHKRHIAVSGEVPEEEYTIPFGSADIKREGKDATVVATGYMVNMALDVADQLQEKGINVEVIDPRTLEPLDMDTIITSVKKTARVVVVDEDNLRCGPGAEIGMQIVERAFDDLDAPVRRVGARNLHVPAGPAEFLVLPKPQDIADAIGDVLGIEDPLPVKGIDGGTLF